MSAREPLPTLAELKGMSEDELGALFLGTLNKAAEAFVRLAEATERQAKAVEKLSAAVQQQLAARGAGKRSTKG